MSPAAETSSAEWLRLHGVPGDWSLSTDYRNTEGTLTSNTTEGRTRYIWPWPLYPSAGDWIITVESSEIPHNPPASSYILQTSLFHHFGYNPCAEAWWCVHARWGRLVLIREGKSRNLVARIIKKRWLPLGGPPVFCQFGLRDHKSYETSQVGRGHELCFLDLLF